MSLQLISRSADLKRLRDEGYDVQIRSNHLVLGGVPYVTSQRQVSRGTLVSTLHLNGDVTVKPDTHVALFGGEYPCNTDGTPIEKIRHGSSRNDLGDGLVVDHSFSSKPSAGYLDYYEKMTTYVAIISSPAQALDPTTTARTYPAIEAGEDESVFRYLDTASSRAAINAVASKLELPSVGIVGLGGTGSYVLDLVAKTPVRELRLFDGDRFSQHNAFRSPGAPTIEMLRQAPYKVDYFNQVYSAMHRGIVAKAEYLHAGNLHLLDGLSFVFLCLDNGEAKLPIIAALEGMGISFIDVGMGVQLGDDSLYGVLRVTTSTPLRRDHVRAKHRIPFTDGGMGNEYTRNIQVADLNALNASLAVIRWKKLFGFYADLEGEHFTTYTLDGNAVTNEDN